MPSRCILSKFYIKPQPLTTRYDSRGVVSYRNSTSNHNTRETTPSILFVVSYRNSTSNHNAGTTTPNSALLYLIEILHQTTTLRTLLLHASCCILSKFYIKPQPSGRVREFLKGCILSKFYIKPQPYDEALGQLNVVSYRNSTSNHNPVGDHMTAPSVVSYRNSTSNHNSASEHYDESMLYLIEILHQTTTVGHVFLP